MATPARRRARFITPWWHATSGWATARSVGRVRRVLGPALCPLPRPNLSLGHVSFQGGMLRFRVKRDPSPGGEQERRR
jgi:hypothetical protein